MGTPRDTQIPRSGRGRRRVVRVRVGGRRISIGVSGLTRAQRDAIVERIRELRRCARVGATPSQATIDWLGRVPSRLRDKIAAAGIEPPEAGAARLRGMTLARLVELYRARGPGSSARVGHAGASPRSAWAPATIESIDRAADALLRRLGPHRTVASVGHDDLLDLDAWVGAAGHWRVLEGQRSAAGREPRPLAEASRRHYRRVWRAIFGLAVRMGVIDDSPAAMLPARAVVSLVRVMVPRADRCRVLAAIADQPLRTYFSLVAFAGLRAPSETDRLTWAQWDRAASVLRDVADLKNRRVRPMAPVPPELAAELSAEFGRQRGIGLGRPADPICIGLPDKRGRLRRVVAAIRAAGLTPWPRTMDTLREAVETDLAMAGVDPAARAIIMGHSERVAREAYMHVTPEMLAPLTGAVATGAPARVRAVTPRAADVDRQRRCRRRAGDTAGGKT